MTLKFPDGIVTWAEIDLDAISYNVNAYIQHVGPSVEVMAVVKANAYGHGAVPVARTALASGATRLAVHRLLEGIELRQAGIDAPILIMGPTPPSGAEMVARWRLIASLMSVDFAQALSARAVALGTTTPVHIKVDTGMCRNGLMPDEAVDFLRAVHGLRGIVLEGMFTHFGTADWIDQTYVREQLEVFKAVIAAAHNAGIHIPILHACNSAATMRLPEAHFDAVRPGVALYGMDPSTEWPPVFQIRPALTLKSLVCRVREIQPGAGISYGRTFVAKQPMKVALVPVGYGDGYHRILSNQGSVLIAGQRAPILGRVCMDQLVVDVSHIPLVNQDDEVVLVGVQNEDRIRAEEVASLASTINYEISTSLLPRVVRVYKQGGKIVEVI
jgi:alanine racemase